MKRYIELMVAVIVCALVVSFLTQSEPESGPEVNLKPKPSPIMREVPIDMALALNGVKIGEPMTELEKRMGEPDFSWPDKHRVQWDPRGQGFTRIEYRVDDSGERFVTKVEASGTLSRGLERLVSFGDPKEQMIKSLGEPERVEDGRIHWYPGVSLACRKRVGMIVLEGSGQEL